MARRSLRWWFPLLILAVASAGVASTAAAADLESGPGYAPEVWSRLLERSLPVRDDGSHQLQRVRLDHGKAPSELNAILVMCDFADSLMLGRWGQVDGDFPPAAQQERYYAAHDSLYYAHQMQVLADYYSTVSAGRFQFRWTIHPRVINLPQPMGHYGNHPERGENKIEMVAAVIDSLQDEINFAAYDTYLVVHAGAGEETDILGDSPEQIYSSFLSPEDFAEANEEGLIDQPYIPCRGFADGTGIDQVLVLPETEYQDPFGDIWDGHFGSLGVYCFEVGLRLGMLSLSDFTPAGRPDSQGIGQYGLMGYGLFTGIGLIPPQPCAFNKALMGWVDVVELDPMTFGRHVLAPAQGPDDPGTIYRVSLTGQEYWLLEYRLQDADGNRAFSFPDDKNGNHVYDYWDADTPDHRPVRGGNFDASADSLESPLGGEWDFAMSENSARWCGELGFGSGAYIWHIDEGRIRDVFDAPTNLFNGDSSHKSVDLEEADGIQDLDSAEPTAYWLGSDNDSFRGEGGDQFGPATYPSTETATGQRTGIAFTEFSEVFQRYTPDTVYVYCGPGVIVPMPAIQYADSLAFTLSHESALDSRPQLAMRRDFEPGVDLRGSHLLVVDLDATGTSTGCDEGGPGEIVVAARTGEVFVLGADLNEVPDQDGDPLRISPIATGMRHGEAVHWNLPPAVGDLDGDGSPEIILTSPDALFAFEADGDPIRDVEAGAFGFYKDLGRCELPPVLVPADRESDYCPTEAVDACVVTREGDESTIRFFGGPDAAQVQSYPLGRGVVTAPPIFLRGRMLFAFRDTLADRSTLNVLRLTIGIPEDPGKMTYDLGIEPGPFPVSVTPLQNGQLAVHVVGLDGQTETLVFEDDLSGPPARYSWREELVPRTPLSPGQAFVGDGRIGRAGHYGHWNDGWPRRVTGPTQVAADSTAACPLVVRLPDADLPLWQYLFTVRDGRIFATGTQGEPAPYWPLAGPARAAATPAVGPIGEQGPGDLVAIGTFSRISGWDESADSLDGVDVSSIYLWKDVAGSEPLWPMWGGSPWRNGNYDLESFAAPPFVVAGNGLVEGSHECYPSPLLTGPLHVRGSLRSPGQVRAFVYNLEGEEVTRTEWVSVSAPDPFTIEVPVDGAVTGVYLSRLEVLMQDGGTESSVLQFAIVH